MIRRIVSRLTLLAAVATIVSLLSPSVASADSSCFNDLARAGIPPGQEFVSEAATRLAQPGTPGSGVPAAAREIGLANQVREDICQ